MTTVQDRLRERFDRLKKLYMKKAEEIFEKYWEDELTHNEIVVQDDPYDIYRLDGWGQRGSEWTDYDFQDTRRPLRRTLNNV